MGSMIGPISLTVGQPYRVQLAQDTSYIEVQNDSLYDVWIYFGETQPTDITNANNTWHRVVRRQHNGVLPVEGYKGASARERVNNAIGAFAGTLWLLAVNPGGLAATGTGSGRSQVYLTPYAQGDSLPAHSSLSTQSDLTSQPRIIALPVGVAATYAGTWATADASPKRLASFLLADKQLNYLGSPTAYFYLYYANLTPQAGETGGFNFTIEVVPETSSNVATGAAYVVAYGVAQGNVPWVFAPTWPFISGSDFLPANTQQLTLQIKAQAGARINMVYTIAGSMDPSNVVYNPEIGYGQFAVVTDPSGGSPLF